MKFVFLRFINKNEYLNQCSTKKVVAYAFDKHYNMSQFLHYYFALNKNYLHFGVDECLFSELSATFCGYKCTLVFSLLKK